MAGTRIRSGCTSCATTPLAARPGWCGTAAVSSTRNQRLAAHSRGGRRTPPRTGVAGTLAPDTEASPAELALSPAHTGASPARTQVSHTAAGQAHTEVSPAPTQASPMAAGRPHTDTSQASTDPNLAVPSSPGSARDARTGTPAAARAG